MTACEYTHIGTGVPCDGDAAFILYAHKRRRPICEAIAQRLWTKMRERCYECRRPKFTHWEIQSIHHAEASA
jgi:hypothetical protein